MKYGVFVGRFQPFHIGHAHVVEQALQKVDKLIIVIGSADRARNTRNPFMTHERMDMIRRSFHWECESGRIILRSIPDYPSDDRWEADLRKTVNSITSASGAGTTVGLVGQAKDHSSFYIKKFPEWEPVAIDAGHYLISATHIRERFIAPLPEIATGYLPKGTVEVLTEFQKGPYFPERLEEAKARAKKAKDWSAAPFPNKDYCADVVAVQSGHIALVTRGKWPGKGLLALPGGNVNEFERIRRAGVREFREETHISDSQGRIPHGRLDSYIVAEKQYDDPYRSDFGRVITTAFLMRLPDAKPLWTIKGMDDAVFAGWYPIDKLDSERFHDDHFYIIQEMLGL